MIRRRQRRFAAGRVGGRPVTGSRRTPPRAGVEALEDRTLLAADLVISEFMASNNSTLADKDGQYSDWIELHNRGDAGASLDGWFLTDDSNNLTQWLFPAVSLPAGGYLTVFASSKDLTTAGQELHTNFKLDAAGEYLALVKPDGVTVQHAYAPSFPSQSADISYGLTSEDSASSGLQFFTTPTPGAANAPNAPAPTFSVSSRTFTGSLSITLSSSLPGAQIRYTTNRSVPTSTSTLYSGPITITNDTVVRARVFATGRSPSPIVSQTYFALDTSVQSFNSNLPVVIVDTFGGGLNDVSLTGASAYFIDTAADDGRAEMLDAPDFAGRGGIRLRGQTSQGFEKQPYAFETWDETDDDKKVSILGMPKESDWILYNPYSEKTLMQNYLAYMWSNRIGQYAVRTRYVELFMNSTATGKVDYTGDYRGIYIFMEKIKVDDDRVDIAKLGPNDNAEPDVTGGYIWRKDKFDTSISEPSFTTNSGQTFLYHEPDPFEITQAQQNYLTNYINEFESVLYGPNYADPVNGYAKYIDVDSWIDHHIIVELTKNIDGFRLSTFYTKDRNGKIKMGPVWDYNLSLGNADYNNGWLPTGWYHDILGDGEYPYWRRLFSDPNFQQKYIDRWQQLRKDELSTPRLMSDIDNLTNLLSDGNGNYPVGQSPVQQPTNPLVRNFTKWKILGVDTWPNWYTDPSWINQVNWTKDWLRQRVQWWDSQYVGMPDITPDGGPVTQPTQVTITSTGGTTFVDTPLLTTGNPAKAIVPTGDIGTGWVNRTGFDDSAWLSGTTGVGYDQDRNGGGDYIPLLGLNLDAPPNNQAAQPMRNINGTAYIRIPFNVQSPAAVQSLILRMRYDDGFIAYLNGTQIASNNTNGLSGWNAVGAGNHDAAGFEEFDVTQFKNVLVAGNNLLAIQGINTNLGSSDLLMLPELVSRGTTTQSAPVYYTTDGSDPRAANGTVGATARLYSGPFTVSSTTRVRARSLLSGKWSGVADELYDFGENRLRVSEIMYNPAPPAAGSPYLPGDFEYVELQNTGTQAMNLAGVHFDKGIDFTFGNYTLNAGARVLVVRNLAAFQSRYGTGKPVAGAFTGALSDGGERIRLLGKVNEPIQDFSYDDDWYKQTDGEGYSLTVVDPAQALAAWGTKEGWRASEPLNGTPGSADTGVTPNAVVINEVMTNPSTGGDWVELRNTTGASINVGNWWLSNSAANLKKWQVPANTTIAANGYLVFTQSQFGGAFTLSASGDGIYLSSGDAAGNLGGYRVDETFNAADPGVPFGRYVKSTGGADFTALVSATQGAANAAPLVGPVVINEIMYSPQGTKSEYIELRNLTNAPIQLGGANAWKMVGGIDYIFPAGATIDANGFAILSAIDPATFRQQYTVPANVPVFGPYTLANGTNVLSDGGESIRLARPGASGGFVDVDRVAYDDAPPWPAETSGTGQSLARKASNQYGNDPVNWGAELFGGSPGRPNLDGTPPTADVVDVAPDPRTTAVTSVTVVFSEAVTGVDLADFSMTRNGANVVFTGAETLASGDGGKTWVLGNLDVVTGAAGTYVLTLNAANSGITDGGGRALAASASDTWLNRTSDTTAPSADITDVTPDPRGVPVNTVTIVFSEPVTGFDLADLTLKRDGGGNLLSAAAHTLSSSDGGITFTLSGLAGVTGADGQYVLALKSSGTGITDLGGNALAGGASDDWVVDVTGPTGDWLDVSPTLRASPVDRVTFVFSEPVTGLDWTDLRLGHNGGPNLITAAQTVTTNDGGKTWVLGNLTPLTSTDGDYALWIVTAGSNIVDASGNPMATVDPDTIWHIDTVRPAADVVDVNPDPRSAPVNSIAIHFSEPVTGFDLQDLQLGRAGGPGNVLTAAQTLTTVDNQNFVLGNLSSITGAEGQYTLTLVSGVSGIQDAAGNSLPVDATESWTVDTTAPTVDVVDVTPELRLTPVDSITIEFSEPVTGFDLSDLTLTVGGGGNLLQGAQGVTLTSADGKTWTLAGLEPLTGTDGNYTLDVSAAAVTDAAGNLLAGGAEDSWTMVHVDGTPPLVTNLYLSGSAWTAAFRQFLSTQGQGSATYGFVPGGPDQLNELPWTNLNQISITFDQNVQVAQDDLQVRGVNVPTYAIIGFTYESAAKTATWTLGQAIVNDQVMIDLDGDEGTGVSFAGRPLDGEWNNAGDTFPSGDGNPGGDFRFRVNVLPGDVNRSGGSVNAIDLAQVRGRQLTSTTNAGSAPNTYNVFCDINGSGNINAVDLAGVRSNQLKTLPGTAPTATDGGSDGASITRELFSSSAIL